MHKEGKEMKKITKKILSCFSIVLAASVVGGISMLKAQAEEGEVATPVFAAADLAGIRLPDGDNVAGIRWEITMNQAYYDSLQVAEDATVQFGAYVAPTKNFTGSNAKPAQAQDITIGADFALGNVEGNADVFTYYATLNYSNVSAWTEEKQAAAYALELSVIPYVRVGGEEFYGEVGASRSMEALALHYLQNNTYTQEEVGAYLKSEVLESEENTGFYSILDGEGLLENPHGLTEAGYRAAYVGAQPVELEFSNDGKGITVSGAENLVAGEKSEYSLNVFTSDRKVYTQTFTAATKVIDEASDLSMFYLGDEAVGGSNYPAKNEQSYTNTAIFDGYYVLADDIDCTGYTHYVLKKENKVDTRVYFVNETHPDAGLTGMFDGRGHTISNLTMTKGGLFGGIVGGTVKNVAFTNVSFSDNTWKDENGTTVYGTINDSCTLATFMDRALVENVYIYVPTMALPSRSGVLSRNALVSSFITQSTVMKNCIFKCDTYTYGADNTPGVGSYNKHYGSIMSDCRGTNYQWENVYVISNVALAYTSTKADYCADASNVEGTTYKTPFTGVYRFNTEADMLKADINYSAFAQSGYWQVMPNALPYVSDSAVEVVLTKGNYELNHETGKFSDTDMVTLFGSAEAVIEEATLDGAALDVAGGKVNVPVAQHGDALMILYRLQGETKFYAVTTTVVTKYIDEASDLSMFYLGDEAVGGSNYPAKNEQSYIKTAIFDGYYVLVDDIDCTGYTHYVLKKENKVDTRVYFKDGTHPDAGLTGVFDGRGHTISNLTMTKGGLFGGIVGGTVKNVAFTNVSFSANTWKDENGTTVYGTINDSCTLATFMDRALVENVYIYVPKMALPSRNGNVSRNALVSSFITQSTVMKNCIFKCDTYTYGDNLPGVGSNNKHYGSLMSDCRGTDYQWENVYVISNVALAYTSTKADYCADASNVAGTTYQTPFTGVYRYNTQDDFAAAQGNDYKSFSNSDYWDTTSGIPVWGAPAA